MIKRDIFYNCLDYIEKDEIIIITGARQVGKTTVLKQLKNYLKENGKQVYLISLEDPEYLKLLNEHPRNLLNIYPIKKNKKNYFLVDEIQYLDNPTNFLKYIFDHYSDFVKLLVTGSSAFYIDEKFKDSLAGRKKIFNLHSVSFFEFFKFKGEKELSEKLSRLTIDKLDISQLSVHEKRLFNDYFPEYMIFGGYPKVVTSDDIETKKEVLFEILNSYTKKDLLESGIKNQEKVYDLLKILSAQSGSLLNINSLCNTLQTSYTAISNYIYVLKKSFIISEIRPFYRNIKKEIRKMPKSYFNDLGLRNAVIRNFIDLKFRQDIGTLYENLIFRLLLDKTSLENINFWRTQDKHEIDFIIEKNKSFEVKYNITSFKKSRYDKFVETYPEVEFRVFCHLADEKNNSKLKIMRI